MKLLNIVVLIAFNILFSFQSSASEALKSSQPSIYKFAVFPYLSPSRLDNIYSPICNELSKSLNQKVTFTTSSTFERFLQKLKNEKFDIALIQPFWYPVAVDKSNYQPAINMKEPFTSLIVVPEKSKITKLSDLRNKVIATPPEFVPVVKMARTSLLKEGLIPDKDVSLESYRTVDSCLQKTLTGQASACISPPFAKGPFENATGIKFRIIYESFSIPNLALVIHPRVPKADRTKIIETLLNFKNSKSGKNLLTNIHTNGFIMTNDSDYDIVRKMLTKEANR